jgi:hypothetical protein
MKMYFTSDTQYCEKLADDFHLVHLKPYEEIFAKVDQFTEWPAHHIAAHTPSTWLMKQEGFDFFDSVYGKGGWMSLIFRLPPNHTGLIHEDGTNDTYNFVIRPGGCTRWYDRSKLSLLKEMKNFTKAENTQTTKIFSDIEEYLFEADDGSYPNNHLHISIPHRVYNFKDHERLIITVRPCDLGVQEKVNLIDEMLLMKYYVGRDWNKPMDVNEWLDNYIKEKFNNN